MKRPGALLASAAAAAAATFASLSDHDIKVNAFVITEKISETSNSKSAEEAFAPRFDGLRFIETLVTAHR